MICDPRDYIYDIESYPNVFTCSARHTATGRRYLYEISNRRNDRWALYQWLMWLKENGCRMVGFNNFGFDYPLLNFIMKNPLAGSYEIHQLCVSIIQSEERNQHIIWHPEIPQVDLYRIHDFDRPTKATSLKTISFNRRSENIIDLPFPPGSLLTDEQIDILIAYNDHDVDDTEALYLLSQEQIKFREEMSQQTGLDLTNANDPKIGKEYFIMRLEQAAPGACYEPGTRKPLQTWRSSIDFAEVVFPSIPFKRPEFQAVYDWFRAQTITETKGVFSNIPEDRLGALAQYSNLTLKRERYKEGATYPTGSYRNDAKNGSKYVAWRHVENLHTVVNGFQFDFGTGGIHGSVSSRIVTADDEHDIVDVDVASYYPNLAIQNRVYPAHLGELFCDIYQDVYVQRKKYPKGSSMNNGMKLALNATYGQTNNVYSPFFDPQYTMTITVNGQLLLCLLADYLMDIPGLEMIQINTDGLTVKIPKAYRWVMSDIMEWWQKLTRLELEAVEYRAMWIRDVNNYIAQTADGKKIKRKGAYAHVFNPPNLNKGDGDLEWHQDHSMLIIPKAAEAALVRGEDIATFIFQHTDPYDFMAKAKVPRNCRLLIDDRQVQNVTRYAVTRDGGSMVKVMPPLPKNPHAERRIGICAGYRVTEYNDALTFDRNALNYDYYIREAEKLVRPLLEGTV